MATKYPVPTTSKRIYFCYLLRLKDLLVEHGRKGWQMFRQSKTMKAAAERENKGVNALIDW